jgi:uncharacterized protein YihD (DUF1040 family)
MSSLPALWLTDFASSDGFLGRPSELGFIEALDIIFKIEYAGSEVQISQSISAMSGQRQDLGILTSKVHCLYLKMDDS